MLVVWYNGGMVYDFIYYVAEFIGVSPQTVAAYGLLALLTLAMLYIMMRRAGVY